MLKTTRLLLIMLALPNFDFSSEWLAPLALLIICDHVLSALDARGNCSQYYSIVFDFKVRIRLS